MVAVAGECVPSDAPGNCARREQRHTTLHDQCAARSRTRRRRLGERRRPRRHSRVADSRDASADRSTGVSRCPRDDRIRDDRGHRHPHRRASAMHELTDRTLGHAHFRGNLLARAPTQRGLNQRSPLMLWKRRNALDQLLDKLAMLEHP
jgi:hypothetical protein